MVRQASSNLRQHWNDVLNLNSQVNAEEKWTRIPKTVSIKSTQNSELGQFLCFCCIVRTLELLCRTIDVAANSWYLLLCFQMVLQMTVQKTVLVRERVRQMKKGLKPVAMPKIDRKNEAFSPKLPQISCERGYSSIYLWVYMNFVSGWRCRDSTDLWTLYCKIPFLHSGACQRTLTHPTPLRMKLIWIWDNFQFLEKKTHTKFFFFSQLLTHKIRFNFEISN